VWKRTLFISSAIFVAVAIIGYGYIRFIGLQAESAIQEGRRYIRPFDPNATPSLKDSVLAIQSFRHAVSLQPSSARAHAHLGWAYFVSPDPQYRQWAGAEARRAVELDPKLAEAHEVAANIAWYLDWDFPAALREASLALDSGANVYRLYTDAASVLGKFEDAAGRLREARLKGIHVEEEEAKLYFRTGQSDKLRAMQGAWPYWRALGMEDPKEAEATLRQALQLIPDHPAAKAALGYVLARQGKREEALEIASFFTHPHLLRIYSPTSVALIHTGLGDTDQACSWLEKARTEHDRNLPLVAADPRFRSLPCFRPLLTKLGLP
jgi:tetratricopeptide (TPR) repeat protein